MPYEIQSDIPMPPNKRGRPNVYPFNEMNVGDSFFFQGKLSIISSAASCAGKRHSKKYALRRVTEDGVTGFRVWRVK